MTKPVLGNYPNQFHPVHTVPNYISKIPLYIIFQTQSSNSKRSLSKMSNQRNIQAMWPANYNNLASLSLIFSVKHFSVLKTQEEGFSEMSVPMCHSILSHFPKYRNINAHCRENLEFLKLTHASTKNSLSLTYFFHIYFKYLNCSVWNKCKGNSPGVTHYAGKE
jgi:hypothetical protein